MVNTLKNKNIVKLILNSLSEYTTIPGDGFLCGGAVANTIINMEWGINTPINDLDIFVESKSNKMSTTPLRTDKLVISSGYHHLNSSYNHGNNYRIISSDRDGMINIVKVSRVSNGSSKNYMYILKGFDFNCTQVGIDLKTGELIYTPEFERFLNDRQLKVVSPYTPGHTAIRLFKKIDELGCYCDIEGQMNLLSQPFNNETMLRNNGAYRGVFGMYFGIKYKELYEKYKDKIGQYFKLVSFFEHKKWAWEKQWGLNNIKEVATPSSPYHVLNWLDPNRNPPQNILEKWATYNGRIWGLIPVKYNLPDKEFISIINNAFSPLTLITVWNMLYGGLKKTSISKIKTIFKYNNLKEICMVNDGFYDCDFSDKNASYLNDLISNNPTLGLIIYKYNLNLQDSLELQKNINKILNKEGHWFSDIIYKLIIENGNGLVYPNLEVITSLFNKEKDKLTIPFVKNFDLSGLELPDGVQVKELVSDYDLAYAGRTLRNCINNPNQGYKGKIKSGITKIFVIITKGSMSALELYKQSDFLWNERWTLSYCNKECNEYHKNISKMIVAYFHKELILSNISEEIKKWENSLTLHKNNLNVKQDTTTSNNKVHHDQLFVGELVDYIERDISTCDESYTITDDVVYDDANLHQTYNIDGGDSINVSGGTTYHYTGYRSNYADDYPPDTTHTPWNRA